MLIFCHINIDMSTTRTREITVAAGNNYPYTKYAI